MIKKRNARRLSAPERYLLRAVRGGQGTVGFLGESASSNGIGTSPSGQCEWVDITLAATG